jgi:hypothetical protein
VRPVSESLPGGALTVAGPDGLRDDDRRDRLGHAQRWVEDPGGRRAPLWLRPGHHVGPAAQLPAAAAEPDHLAGGLQHVPRLHRGQEADRGVAGQQALVAVGADGQLRRDVTEQAQGVGAVDQRPAVVGVRVGHVAAVGDGHAESRVGRGHGVPPPGTSADTR